MPHNHSPTERLNVVLQYFANKSDKKQVPHFKVPRPHDSTSAHSPHSTLNCSFYESSVGCWLPRPNWRLHPHSCHNKIMKFVGIKARSGNSKSSTIHQADGGREEEWAGLQQGHGTEVSQCISLQLILHPLALFLTSSPPLALTTFFLPCAHTSPLRPPPFPPRTLILLILQPAMANR
ncbi:hypothetical protein EYF80_031418 [Liparis tanakae]|uniref:Uncharacterized protein n=1 Tax=Liparis tanakae TaxID=230148 RepID=A0A4Z2GZ35_9TELE|nr:hypothetical protein EYF80_031418 [Liparis tanakae]